VRDNLIAEGKSADSRIHIAVKGMRHWTVRIADGTVRTLTEEQFASGVREAARELINDQFAKVQELKQKIYD
jgi:hypothetical protein